MPPSISHRLRPGGYRGYRARPALPRRTAGERGAVTAELALAMPSVVLLLAVVVAVAEVAAGQLRCIDAARAAVRLAARGEPAGLVTAAAARAAPGSTLQVTRSGRIVRARVGLQVALPGLLPAVAVSAGADALDETRSAPEPGTSP